MIYLDLYSKDNCHLCDAARETLQNVQKNFPSELREHKLSEGGLLFELYKDKFPVVIINDNEFCYGRIDTQHLISHLTAIRDGG